MAQFTVGTAAWRQSLVEASFRGVQFKVEHDSMSGGRRNVTFEFAKRDIPYTEDLGRKAHRYQVTGYVIGPNYLSNQQALIAALDTENFGTLQHPLLLGQVQVNVDSWTTSILNRARGGIATFDMTFVEAGNLAGSLISIDTAVAAISSATSAVTPVTDSVDSNMQGLIST